METTSHECFTVLNYFSHVSGNTIIQLVTSNIIIVSDKLLVYYGLNTNRISMSIQHCIISYVYNIT